MTMPYAALWLVVWSVALPFRLFSAEDTYTVKRGDTVYSIGRRYGVSTAELAERNGLGRNYHIYPGQRLFLPKKTGGRTSASAKNGGSKKVARVVLPRSVQRAIDKAPVKRGRWKYIVIHHSGVDTGTVKSMDKYHREVRHMEHGLAYHFVIGNGDGMKDGEIAATQRWIRQLDGGHLASVAQNRIALGICLVGNFDRHAPTSKELSSLKALIKALLVRCKLTVSAVKTHQQINVVHTRCPGSKFPTKAFLDSLR